MGLKNIEWVFGCINVSKWDFFIGFILLLYYIKILRERDRERES